MGRENRMERVTHADAAAALHSWLRAIHGPGPFRCSGCGGEHGNYPTWTHFTQHVPVLCAWCSPVCEQRGIARILAQGRALRAAYVGQGIVGVALGSLWSRQPIPEELRYAMTEEEYCEVRRRCSDEYTRLRQAVLRVFVARIGKMAHMEERA